MTGNPLKLVLDAPGLGRAPCGWRVKVTLSLAVDRSGSGIVDFCTNEEDMKEERQGKRCPTS